MALWAVFIFAKSSEIDRPWAGGYNNCAIASRLTACNSAFVFFATFCKTL